LRVDFVTALATVSKRDAKQLPDAHIFHTRKPERAERMLDRLPLRIEDGRLELDGDGGFHRRAFYPRGRTLLSPRVV
jgi:hypothetical protein